jgi:hypothetical protein
VRKPRSTSAWIDTGLPLWELPLRRGKRGFALRDHGVEAPPECLGCGWAFNDKKIIVLPFESRSREIRGTGPKPTVIDLVTLKGA